MIFEIILTKRAYDEFDAVEDIKLVNALAARLMSLILFCVAGTEQKEGCGAERGKA